MAERGVIDRFLPPGDDRPTTGTSSGPGLSTVLIGLLGCLSFVAVLAGFGVVWAGVRTTRASQQHNREGVVRALAKLVDLRLRTAEELIQAGAHRPGLILFMRSNAPERVKEVLRVICEQTPYYRAAFVVTPELAPVVAYGLDGRVDRSSIAALRDHLASGRRHDERVVREGRLYSVAAVQVDSRLIGYLVGEIDLRRVAQDIDDAQQASGSIVAYVASDGAMIAGSRLNAPKLTPPRDPHEVMHTSVNDDYVATWGRAPPNAWVVLLTPRDVAIELESVPREVGGLLLIIWLLFVGGAAWALQSWVIAPARRIADAAHHVTEGDLAARAPPTGIRELNFLSAQFNEMTGRLVQLIDTVRQDNALLEARIRTRTAELAHALEEAEIAGRAKDRFVATVSHELRTPLQGIVASAELLEAKALNDDARQYTTLLQTFSRSLQSIIGQILDFSKLDVVPVAAQDTPFTPPQLLNQVRSSFETRARAKGLALQLHADTDAACVGDAPRILQIIGNLVDNAVKFTSTGSIDVHLGVARSDAGHDLTVDVIDTGPGIPVADHQRVFERFFRLNSDASIEGLGLGLAICAKLARHLDGQLNCVPPSTRAGGAHFRLTVPVQTLNGTNRSKVSPGDSKKPPTRSLSFGAARPLALVADDHEVNRMLLGRLLEGIGFEPVHAATVERAIEVLGSRFVTVAFIDWHMPPARGDAVARAVRAVSSRLLADCPLICTTGVATADVRRASSEAGFDSFLVKPVNRARLTEALTSPPLVPQITWRAYFANEVIDDLRTMTSDGDAVVFDAAAGLQGALLTMTHSNAPLVLRDDAHRLCGLAANLGAEEAARIFRALEHSTNDEEWAEISSRARSEARTLLDNLDAILALSGEASERTSKRGHPYYRDRR